MIMEERKIRVSNMPEGHGIDRAKAETTIAKFYDKLAGRLGETMVMEVHFKEAHTGGKREQVEAHVKIVVAGGKRVLASKQIEWNAEKAVHAALAAVFKEAQKSAGKK